MKFIEVEKMNKKAKKEYFKKKRVMADFNTGVRTMKTEKNPTRAERKNADRKRIEQGE